MKAMPCAPRGKAADDDHKKRGEVGDETHCSFSAAVLECIWYEC